MSDLSSPPAEDTPIADSTGKRRRKKRSYVACRRCHRLKVRCSGGDPCQRCQSARKPALCEYPARERRVTISARYLDELQNSAIRRSISREAEEVDAPHDDLNGNESHPSMAEQSRSTNQVHVPSRVPPVDSDISNPIHEPRRIFQLDQGSRQQFVGESTCLAFGDRILQCLNPQSMAPFLTTEHQYVRDPIFARQLNSANGCKLPERIKAKLLVRVALRFIGKDYQFFLHDDFLHQLDKAYEVNEGEQMDALWACKFFVVLALGEMYSTSMPKTREARATSVPGTGYFLTAVGLLQDLFEEPSVSQIETMLLFCFYSYALGRIKSAHMYSGMAVRLSTCLGLHRSVPTSATMPPLEREHRVRLWWTVYVFDRSTCSKLGQPVTIQDADIDVEMPSADMLASDQLHRLGQPDHLLAYVNLARITGLIMKDIYSPSSKANAGQFVQNVRHILQKLRKWDVHIPESMRWNPEGSVPRPVASLQLHYSECIMLVTRPILLYVLKMKNPFANAGADPSEEGNGSSATISDTTKSLAESCISAARTTNSIISQLFVDNSLAICGFFDAHHLFTSTLVLIISAITSPNSSDSDAVQTAFQLLMLMRDNGNAAAGQYFSRLVQIQWNVSRLFTRVNTAVDEAEPTTHEDDAAENVPMQNAASPELPPFALDELETYDWSNFLMANSYQGNYDDGGMDAATADPLDNPLLQAFLDHTDANRDENSILNAEEIEFVL